MAAVDFEQARGEALITERIWRLVTAHPDATDDEITELLLAEQLTPMETRAMVLKSLTEGFEELFEQEVAAGRAVRNDNGTYTILTPRPDGLPLPGALGEIDDRRAQAGDG